MVLLRGVYYYLAWLSEPMYEAAEARARIHTGGIAKYAAAIDMQ
jgi:hypothetical protein